jgi:hypothetical protein
LEEKNISQSIEYEQEIYTAKAKVSEPEAVRRKKEAAKPLYLSRY